MKKSLKTISFAVFYALLFVMLVFLLPACGEKVYTVSFYDENKTLIETVKVEEGKAANIETPTKEPTTYLVYNFTNWSFEDGEDATEALSSVSSDLAVYANFVEEDRCYSVTYYNLYDNDDPLVLKLPVKAGGKPRGFSITPPQSDVYEYTFEGWVDENGNDMTEQLQCVLQDLTVYAKFNQKQKTYSLTVDENVTVTYGSEITSENDEFAVLPYGAELTITFDVPEGYSSASLSVRGAQKVEGKENVYRVTGDVTVRLLLVE